MKILFAACFSCRFPAATCCDPLLACVQVQLSGCVRDGYSFI